MGRYLEETNRALRRETWELVAQRRLQEADKFDDIFDRLVQLRQQIARNAGYDNYRDYAFRKLGRFDYTPSDCESFHRAVETEVMPVVRELQRERRSKLGLENLLPWDLTVDPQNRAPLRPFERVEEMVERTQNVFQQLDPDLAAGFRQMQTLHLLDLGNRKGKAPGGYQSTLPESRVPFIFMNAICIQRDVETILHEAGHAFHSLATRKEDLYAYRSAPIEFCEVASMSMELLGNDFLEEFYRRPEANRARRTHLEGIMNILPWIATVDAFQHWIYTHQNHTRSERESAWVDLMTRFGGEVDWEGHEAVRARLWQRQLHIFIHAFYYIEYGIAQLGALQVLGQFEEADQAGALQRYKSALELWVVRAPLPGFVRGCRLCKIQIQLRHHVRTLVRLVKERVGRARRKRENLPSPVTVFPLLREREGGEGKWREPTRIVQKTGVTVPEPSMPVGLDLVVQSLTANAKSFGGLEFIAAGFLKHLNDGVALNAFEERKIRIDRLLA